MAVFLYNVLLYTLILLDKSVQFKKMYKKQFESLYVRKSIEKKPPSKRTLIKVKLFNTILDFVYLLLN